MPRALADIFRDLEVNDRAKAAIRNAALLTLWPQVVDERVVRHAEPIKILNRTLYLSVSSSVWAQELSLLKREIVAKFNCAAGKEVIQDLRIKASGD